MSSEGSISVQSSAGSRIRQFGLYRTIDARTEEFLKLSRKRQIRQGCACAAASTAITVTVVVVVFFIYEFSLNSETNLESTLKSNWLSLMNDTSENSSFDSKLTKANIDRTTLKLLPLLIKAIKKNSFLETLLEDHSNSSNDDKNNAESTEETVDKSAFSTNWFKFPTTKLYAIEYKTSPVVYYKHPTKNIEYYTKIRKIRDYQRVFNYVDKMISEKVYIGATRPMLKGEMYTEKPFVAKNRKNDKITTQKSTALNDDYDTTTPIDEAVQDNDPGCKCPKKIGVLLNKILSSIQKLIPDTTTKTRQNIKNVVNLKHYVNTSSKINTTPANKKRNFLKFFTRNMAKPRSPSSKISQSIEPKKSSENTLMEHVTYANSNYPQFLYGETQPKSSEITTETKNYIDGTKVEDNPGTTKSMQYINKYRNIINRKNLLRKKTTLVEIPFNGNILENFERKKFGSTPIIPNELKTTIDQQINLLKNKLNLFSRLENRLKLKNNNTNNPFIDKIYHKHFYDNKKIIMSSANNKIKQNSTTYYDNTNLKVNKTSKTQKNNRIDDKLLFDFTNTKIDNSKEIVDIISQSPILKDTSNNITMDTETTSNRSINKDTKNEYNLIKSDLKEFLNKNFLKNNETEMIPRIIKQSNNTANVESNLFSIEKAKNKTLYRLIGNEIEYVANSSFRYNSIEDEVNNTDTKPRNKDETSVLDIKITSQKNKINSDIVDDDVEFISGDFPEDTKHAENILDNMIANQSKMKEESDFAWEDLKHENVPSWKSLIPHHRPTYLEIHRATDVKHYEPLDDDYNMNANFYDLNM